MQNRRNNDISETLQDILGGIAKFLMGVGALCTLICTALLIVLCVNLSKDSSHGTQAMQSIELFGRLLMAGVLGLAVGTSYIFWGEDVASALLVLFSAALYFAPLYVPSFLTAGSPSTAIQAALEAIQTAGELLGVISIAVLAIEVGIKVRQRVKVGTKADQLKFGKGIKEESDRQNVFMGNCWQLPYCRKFVRERCPIFHAKRTCWRERTGCMCEEEVIRNAMENKPIPKDALLAANMIPRNHRLTPQQKFERCKSCVIYNEHQRHKYRLFLPLMIVSFIALYAVMHGPLVAACGVMVDRVNGVLNNMTLSQGHKLETPQVFVESLLFVGMIVLLTYALKGLEFLIFKLKV